MTECRDGSMRECVYVFVHARVYVCSCQYVYEYLHAWTENHVCMYISVHVCMHTFVYMHIFVCLYICVLISHIDTCYMQVIHTLLNICIASSCQAKGFSPPYSDKTCIYIYAYKHVMMYSALSYTHQGYTYIYI